ncbi:hypothetical protein CJ204_06590 [Corynebacterium xerosis]|uniref:DUF294 domain-containing protein n=1 Tax=Corynebacterium xerosis TaxID=1725 RepID=A0A2N6SYV0_9CORY|nr:putative nucleotidyltransferase substrate binding domain-containing protein [Corynebacterium xerosis]PMC62242.1 hypothetical protein CJ204_06590 [Corynebacterium xerosis]
MDNRKQGSRSALRAMVGFSDPSAVAPYPADRRRITRECAQRRRDGESPMVLAAEWSAHVKALLDPTVAATGSTGRGEATPWSDLDAIRVSGGPAPRLAALIDAGMADANGVTADDPHLPRNEDLWRRSAWIWSAHPSGGLGVVKMGLLADAAHPMRAAAAESVPGSPMVADMLRDALSTTIPSLGRWRHRRKTIHVKRDLLTPVVKLARWAALASGSEALATCDRIAAADDDHLDHGERARLAAAFETFFALKVDAELGTVDPAVSTGPVRLPSQAGAPPGSAGDPHLVTLAALPASRHDALRRAANDARSVQRAVGFRLSTSGYAPDPLLDCGESR